MRVIDENTYTANSIRTFTGKVFDLKILDPNSICIEDIAHSLANTARFAGHLPEMYSVGQHSISAMAHASDNNKLSALLHDASEAYLGDMPSPFKKMMPEYKKIEDRLMRVIAKKFGFEYPLNEQIKIIDRHLLNLEWEAFVNQSFEMKVWTPKETEERFLNLYQSLIQ